MCQALYWVPILTLNFQAQVETWSSKKDHLSYALILKVIKIKLTVK